MPNFSAVCHTFGTYRPGSAKRKSPWVLSPGAFSCLERLVPKVRVELTRSCPHRFLRPTSTESPGNASTYYSLPPGTHYAGRYILMRSGNCRSLSHDLSHAGRAIIHRAVQELVQLLNVISEGAGTLPDINPLRDRRRRMAQPGGDGRCRVSEFCQVAGMVAPEIVRGHHGKLVHLVHPCVVPVQ